MRRTGNHSPEGTLSILARQPSSAITEPIMTMVSRAETAATTPMTFPISAAANVTFNGERYLHAHLLHTFSGSAASTLEISAQARQFSSIMVMVSRESGWVEVGEADFSDGTARSTRDTTRSDDPSPHLTQPKLPTHRPTDPLEPPTQRLTPPHPPLSTTSAP